MKPNLLIIYCDQLNLWGLSCYGGHLIDTPHIDRLANEGIRFNQFFANAAVCTASRACLMTGRYPNQTGIYQAPHELGHDQQTFAQQLVKAGYATGYSGKWHLAGRHRTDNNWAFEPSFGWTDNRYMWNKGHFKHICEVDGQLHGNRNIIGDEHSYSSDWLTARTLEYIDEHQDEPFAYMVSFPDPHQPYRAREPYKSMFPESEVEIPSTFWQEDVPDWLVPIREGDYFPMKEENRGPWSMDRERAFREVKANYCAMIKHLDDCVCRILERLEMLGILDQTLVVFTTDHGDLMGEHGLTQKEYLYEPGYHIPLLARWPERLTAGVSIDQMISTVDVMPTLLELMGCPLSGQEEGVSALDIITSEGRERVSDSEWKNIIFTHPFTFDMVSCFTPEYELGYVNNGQSILFDRRKDPEQVDNLFCNPQYEGIINELTAAMVQHYTKFCPKALPWLRQ